MLEKSVPFYLQIARILRQELADGVYPVSSRMPDELSLASRFGVSKDVIRVSMRLLAQEHLVKPIRSRGTFVCERPSGIGSSIVLMSYHGPIHLDCIRRGIESMMPAYCNLVLKTNSLDELELERGILENLALADVRALVSAPAYDGVLDNAEAYARILSCGVPVLIIDHSLPNLPADEISFDEYNATRKMFRQAMQRLGSRPMLMFVEKSSPDRLSRIRYQAMLDAFQEAGGESENRRLLFYNNPNTAYRVDEGQEMLAAMGNVNFEEYGILCRSTPIAWELCKLLRDTGREGAVSLYSGIGDIPWGDESFENKLYAHYRLFDEFTLLINEVLSARFSGENAPSTPIKRTIGFREMTGQQIRQYVLEKLH